MSDEIRERSVPCCVAQEEVYDEPLSEETSYGVPCDMTVEEARNPELVRPYKLWEDKLDVKLIPDAAFIVFIKREFDKEMDESNEVWQGVEYSKQIQLYTIPYVWWGYFFNKKEYHNRYGYDSYSVKALNPRLSATKMYQKIRTLNMFSHDAINEVYQKTGRGKNVYHIYVSFQDGKIWLSSDSPMKREFDYKDWGDA